MICYTGDVLKNKIMAMESLKSYRKRFCYSELEKYIFEPYDYRVMSIYGLKHTGKTTMMYQMIQQLDDYAQVCLIQCQPGEDTYDLTDTMDSHSECKYFFLEEATCLEDFINCSAVLSDVYATFGSKIVLSGTDSLGFYIAKGDQLFDRTYMLHTTYISYKEYHYLLGRSLEDYIIYGGTLTPEKDFCSLTNAQEYANTAIAENIQHNLDCLGRNGEYGVLATFKHHEELTILFNKIIELYNRQFVAAILDEKFQKDSITKSNISFQQEIMNVFQYTVNMSEKDIDRVIHEAKDYLQVLDVISSIPESEDVIFIQPGLRYCQCTAQIDGLYKSYNIDCISQTLDNDIKGHMLENIVYYQLAKDSSITDLFYLGKYKSSHGKFDLTLICKKNYEAYIIEVKYTDKAVQKQTMNLKNSKVCKDFETKSEAKIIGKIVIYMGETMPTQLYGINYINAEDFLNEPCKMLELVHPLPKQPRAITTMYKDGTPEAIFADAYNKKYAELEHHEVAALAGARALYKKGFDRMTVLATVDNLSPLADVEENFAGRIVRKAELNPQIQQILKERQDINRW